MARPLRQSTATTVVVGPFLDDTDGRTAESALTVASIDVDLYKHAATAVSTSITPAASGSDNDMVHTANGHYSIELTAANTDTLGRLRLSFNVAGALPVWEDFVVLPANVYDSLYGSDRLQVDAVEISGDATAADNAEAFFDGTGYGGTNNVIPTVTTLTNNLTVADILAAFGVTGTVAAGSIAAGSFPGNSGLSSADGFYIGSVLAFTSGSLDGIARKVTGYTGSSRTLTFANAFPSAPSVADAFVILGRID